MTENQDLQERLKMVEERIRDTEKENMEFADRYVSVQSQNDKILNLYVASYQLHSTLDPIEVPKIIEEILINLIGAEEYFICVLDPRQKHPVVVISEGVGLPSKGDSLDEMDPALERVFKGGAPYFRGEGEEGEFMVAIPLKVNNDMVGGIAIRKTFDHKEDGLSAVDKEVLHLLADHASIALVTSSLYGKTKRKLTTMENFIELLKMDELS